MHPSRRMEQTDVLLEGRTTGAPIPRDGTDGPPTSENKTFGCDSSMAQVSSFHRPASKKSPKV